MMVCFCNEFPPGQVCPECNELLVQKQIQDALAQPTTMVLPVFAFQNSKIPLEKYISDFVMSLKGFNTEIGHVMVVFDNTVQGNTIGIGNISGARDMAACVGILKKYVSVLENSIPKLN